MGHARSMLRVTLVLVVASLLVVGAAACSSTDSGTTSDPVPANTGGSDAGVPAEDADPAVALIETKCSMCHTTERVWSASYTQEEWTTTIDRMKANGLVLTDEEYNQIVSYLAQ